MHQLQRRLTTVTFLKGEQRLYKLPSSGLTPREEEVLLHLQQGKTYKAIAKELIVSVSTINTHVEHIRYKLGFTGRRNVWPHVDSDTVIRKSRQFNIRMTEEDEDALSLLVVKLNTTRVDVIRQALKEMAGRYL